jgi:hypothetical protein
VALPEHIKLLPSDIIDGVMGESEYAEHEKAKGMRQLVYVSTQGAEYLFPDHLPGLSDGPAGEFEQGSPQGRLRGIFRDIAGGRVWEVNPIGVFGAEWDDSGLHNETFWLGWSAVGAVWMDAGHHSRKSTNVSSRRPGLVCRRATASSTSYRHNSVPPNGIGTTSRFSFRSRDSLDITGGY